MDLKTSLSSVSLHKLVFFYQQVGYFSYCLCMLSPCMISLGTNKDKKCRQDITKLKELYETLIWSGDSSGGTSTLPLHDL